MGDHLEYGAPSRANADFRRQTSVPCLDSPSIGEENTAAAEEDDASAIGSGRSTANGDSSVSDEIARRLETILSFNPPSTTLGRIENSDIYSSSSDGSSNGSRGSQQRHIYPSNFQHLHHLRFQNAHTFPFQSHSLNPRGVPCSCRCRTSNHLNPTPIDYSQLRRRTRRDAILYNLRAVSLDPATVMAKSSCGFCRGNRPVVPEPPCHACLDAFLDLGEADITDCILHALLQMMHHVMMNSNGTSIFKKLLHVANVHQLRQIRNFVADDRAKLLRLARDTSGSECLMMLIETVKLPIGRILRNKVVKLMKSRHGASVLECSFKNLNYEDNLVFISAALDHCHDLAVARTGCMSLACCILNSKEPERSELLKPVVERSVHLSFDSYGNYVVSCALGLQVRWAADGICLELACFVDELSMHKNGSYVIEKSLTSNGKHFIIEALARLADGKLEEMAQNEFGNYVLKTAVKWGSSNSIPISTPQNNILHYLQLFHRLRRLVMPHRLNPFAKKLYEVIMSTKIHPLQAD